MNIFLAKAVQIPEGYLMPDGSPLPSEIRECALPRGFPFLVDRDTGRPVEIVLLYLIAKFLNRGGWRKNTTIAVTNALLDFWKFLSARQKAWNEISRLDLQLYKDALLAIVSEKTHQRLARATIRGRLSHVVAFCQWCIDERYLPSSLTIDPGTRQLSTKLSSSQAYLDDDDDDDDDDQDLDGNHSYDEHNLGNIDDVRGGRGSRPSAIVDERTIQTLMSRIGPLPLEASVGELCRDRLIAETSLQTGVRVDEVVNLPLSRILLLAPSQDTDDTEAWGSLTGAVAMTLTKTKGLVARRVIFPKWLLREIMIYAQTERAEAVKYNQESNPARAKRQTNALFVNHKSSGKKNSGRKIKNQTVQRFFFNAIRSCELTHKVMRVDPLTGEGYISTKSMHTFHSLRHTFAWNIYRIERQKGNLEPWKEVQERLGHADVITTMRIYLRSFRAEELALSNEVYGHIRHIAASGGHPDIS